MELYDNQGSSTPLTAKEKKAQPVRAKQKKEDRLSLLKSGLFFFALSAARQMGFFHFEAPHSGEHRAKRSNPTGGTPRCARQSHSDLEYSCYSLTICLIDNYI